MARWHSLWMAPAHPPELEREVNIERLVTISRHQPVSAIAHSLSAIVLGVTYFRLAPIPIVALAFVIQVLAFLQFRVWAQHRNRSRPNRVRATTMNRIIAWSLTWGAMWGTLSSVLLYVAPTGGRAPICIVIIGMAAGGMNMLASLPAACAAFLAFSMLPPALVSALSDRRFALLTAAALVLSVVFLGLTSRRNYLSFLDYLRLRLGIARLADEAETASRAKSRFLANMSHELRTPLNAVIGFAEMIHAQVKGPVAPHYIDFARAIDQSGRHLVDIINDILDLSKIQSGTHELDESVTTVRAVAERAAVVISPACQNAKMSLSIEIAPDLPDILVDARRLTQVLINLLSNAVKFSHSGDVVKLEAFVGPGETDELTSIIIQVRDTGSGIPADELQEVLKPFVQSREAERRQIPGTGLGLPLADEIMRMHGGTLDLDSVVGRGTTVTLCLPANRTVATASTSMIDREIAG